MNTLFRSQVTTSVSLALTVVLAVQTLVAPCLLSAQEAPCAGTLELRYRDAERLYGKWRESEAIDILNEATKQAEFIAASSGCRTKVYALLAKCYNRMKNIEMVRDAVENVVRKIIETDPEFDFNAVLDRQELLEIVDKVRESAVPSARRRRLFDFSLRFDRTKPISVAVSKTRTLKIATVPNKIPVTLKLGEAPSSFSFQQSDSISGVLSFTPTEADRGTSPQVTVLAQSSDTARSLTLMFTVREKGSGKKMYLIGGGVALTALAVALLAGGGGGAGQKTKLPDPPQPPQR